MAKEENRDKHAARTTIVGGQPPGNARALESVPVGIEQLLGMAAVDEALAAQLRADRQGVIHKSGLELSPTERAVLSAIDDATLEKMIAKVGDNLEDPERRDFLALASSAMVVLMGGSALAAGLAGCDDKPKREAVREPIKTTGIRPDEPTPPAPTGSRPDRPQPKGPATKPVTKPNRDQAGARADRPIGGLTADTKKEDEKKKPPGKTGDISTAKIGGVRADRPRPTRGIRPDRPRPSKGIRPDRPKRPIKTRGISPDRPGVFDELSDDIENDNE